MFCCCNIILNQDTRKLRVLCPIRHEHFPILVPITQRTVCLLGYTGHVNNKTYTGHPVNFVTTGKWVSWGKNTRGQALLTIKSTNRLLLAARYNFMLKIQSTSLNIAISFMDNSAHFKLGPFQSRPPAK